MSFAAPLHKIAAGQQPGGASPLSLQRKCACGSAKTPLTDMCEDCQSRALQAKLVVGAGDDPLEREADRVAEQVMRMPEAAHRFQVDEEEKTLLQTTPQVQRRVDGEEGGSEAPPIVHEPLRSPGQPLDAATRSFMESRFGHDFSRVRVHTDTRSAEAARAVSALAYTVGRDVVFGAGQYSLETTNGRQLLAHELTHVVQQGGVTSAGGWELSSPDDPHEREAEVAAVEVANGHQPRISPVAAGSLRIHRDLATPRPAAAPTRQRALTKKQIQEAILFNSTRYREAATKWIQDMVGAPKSGTWDEKTVQLVALLQEQYGLKKDGKVSDKAFAFLKREQALERTKLRTELKKWLAKANDRCPCEGPGQQDFPCSNLRPIEDAFGLAKQWLPRARARLAGFEKNPTPNSEVGRALQRHFRDQSTALAGTAVRAIDTFLEKIKLPRCRDACVPDDRCPDKDVMHSSFVKTACYEFCDLFFSPQVGNTGRARAVLHEMAHKWKGASDVAYEGDADYPPPIETQRAGVNADSLASLIRDLGR